MKSAIIVQIEEMCEADLPTDYLQILEAYPPQLLSAARADDGSDSEGLVSDVELLAQMADVLEINQEVRAVTILDPEGQEFRWPDQLLVIGEDGDGDYYCVDLDGENEGVLQFRHHAVEFEVLADSLDEFIEMLTEAYVTRSRLDDDADHDNSDDDESDDPSDEENLDEPDPEDTE